MTFQVIVLEAAELDIEGSLRWYRERSRSAADGFRTEDIEAIDRIASAPLAWSTDEDGSTATFSSGTPSQSSTT